MCIGLLWHSRWQHFDSCVFFFAPIRFCLEQTTSSHRYEKCKQTTHRRKAAGRVFGTLVALETDFWGIIGNSERLASQSKTEEGWLTEKQAETYYGLAEAQGWRNHGLVGHHADVIILRAY